MRFTPFLYRGAAPLRKLYWRIFKPHTFGVRVLIVHPNNPEEVLLIRHSYGNREAWNIPGGGYRPHKETPEVAAVRETEEELGLTPTNLKVLGVYDSGGEGKRDTVTMFAATTDNPNETKLGPEIAESAWFAPRTAKDTLEMANVAKRAIAFAYPTAE